MADSQTSLLAAGMVVSVFLSAFFSMSETGLLTVSRTRLRYLTDQGNARAKAALDLLQRPRRLLATILIGNTLVNIIASVCATALSIQFFGGYGLGIATGILTVILLIGGEITPKSFASEHAEWVALHTARPLKILVLFIRPIERSFSTVSKAILRLTGAARLRPVTFHTEEEIKVLLRIGRERGHIEQREAELIRAIFEFNDLELADIMRPSPEVHMARPDEPLVKVRQLVAQTGHSRFPVLEGTKPLGMIITKDLLVMTAENLASLKVGDIIRPIPRFPPDARVSTALHKMQTDGGQMAAVVDARGDLMGIVTLEDLLEEIVGDITDEYESSRRRTERDRAKLVAQQAGSAPAAPPPAEPL